ncbi:MAG TPA: transposase family protein [Actinospica sp.]|nr:transposase family protein [Actinospica sp.]
MPGSTPAATTSRFARHNAHSCWNTSTSPGETYRSSDARTEKNTQLAADNRSGKTTSYDRLHERVPTLTDLGYLNLSPAIRHPFKRPEGGELTESQTTYNKVIRGVHGVGERANALLKETFAALQQVSLSPTRIGAIAKAALVLLHLEHDRPLPGGCTG